MCYYTHAHIIFVCTQKGKQIDVTECIQWMWVCFVQLKMLYPNDGVFFIHNLRYLKSLKVFLHILTLSFFTDINYTRMIFPKCTPMDMDVLKKYFSRSILVLVLKHEKKIHLKLIKQEVYFIFFQSKKQILRRNNINIDTLFRTK